MIRKGWPDNKRQIFIDEELPYIRLSSFATIPAVNIKGLIWGEDIAIIPEFSFGLEVTSKEFVLSDEHSEYGWFAESDFANDVFTPRNNGDDPEYAIIQKGFKLLRGESLAF